VHINLTCHNFAQTDAKLSDKMALDKGKNSLIDFNSLLREKFYELQVLRAAYYNLLVRIMNQIYIFTRIHNDNVYFQALNIETSKSFAVAQFLTAHRPLVKRNALINRFPSFGGLTRILLFQIFVRCSEKIQRNDFLFHDGTGLAS